MAQRYALMMIVSMLTVLGTPLLAQTAQDKYWGTDGDVKAILPVGNKMYLGGSFGYVGPTTGSFVVIDNTTGVCDASWPKVDGTVYTAIPEHGRGMHRSEALLQNAMHW